MVLKFYCDLFSPPVRAVYLTIKSLDIPVELVEMSVLKRENKNQNYLKVNPFGTVPAIDDDGFVLLDSHAINVHLVTKYGKDDKLYPSDVVKRAIVNQRLFFDAGELFDTARSVGKKIFFGNVREVDEEGVKNFEHCYRILEHYLQKSHFIAGDDVTIADFSVATTVSSMDMMVPVKQEKFPLLVTYLERATSWSHYAVINEPAMKGLKKFLESINFNFSQ